MGLFKFILGLNEVLNEQEQANKEKELDEEMDLYNLDDYEREEVKKGNYEPYNFEDSDVPLDEDDYYYDDEK